VLRADEVADVLMDFDSLAAKKSLLGSAGVIVMDTSTCMVRAIYNLSRFYAHESCGQCTPCREGCGWMQKIIGRVLDGGGTSRDPDLLLDVAGHIAGNTICPLGDAAAWPVQSFVGKFRNEFEEHIARRPCSAAV
jgi:NADH-quinone oxidoreductase subunit F